MTTVDEATSPPGAEQDAAFGHRLRAWRRRSGLSQAELGGDRFSGSYVSHVESGRRRATASMIDFFAGQLGLDAVELSGGDFSAAPVDAAVVRLLGLTVQSEAAEREFAYARAARLALEAAEQARASGLENQWWLATKQAAVALFSDGAYERSHTLAVQLVEHPVAASSGTLRLEALVLAARSARAAGNLVLAETLAREAVALTDAVDWPDHLALAAMSLIGVLMELGRRDEAVQATARLADMRDRVESEQLRGTCYWICGNMALLTGRVADGLAEHERAAELLRPEVDPRAWGRFYKASAQARLEIGLMDGVPGLLDRARQALLLVGNSSDRTELRVIEAKLALAQGRDREALELIEFAIDDEALAEAPHSRASSLEVYADVLVALARADDARRVLREAADAYEESGALTRSVALWRRVADLAERAEG